MKTVLLLKEEKVTNRRINISKSIFIPNLFSASVPLTPLSASHYTITVNRGGGRPHTADARRIDSCRFDSFFEKSIGCSSFFSVLAFD